MPVSPASSPASEFIALVEQARRHGEEDPFGNPVLAVALAITRRLDEGRFDDAGLETLIRELRDDAFLRRAERLAGYLGGVDPATNAARLRTLASRLVRPDPEDSPVRFAAFREVVQRTRFAAVFTAHPTFALPPEVFHALAEAASGRPPAECFVSHRPEKPTLEQEFTQAEAAIRHGRDALDALNRSLLTAARQYWPDRWSDLLPRPVVLSSWVGYDTDGRTDIQWWDMLRLRLRMKRRQLERVLAQVEAVGRVSAGGENGAGGGHEVGGGSRGGGERPAALAALGARLREACETVDEQLARCPSNAEPAAVRAFAEALVHGGDKALRRLDAVLPLFAEAMAASGEAEKGDKDRMDLAVARAGLVGHGLSLAHSHVRLNSAQLHNAIRLRLGFEDPPADPSRRRVLLGAINSALESLEPVPVDFGAILAEQGSATRLMMTVAQIVKHIDGDTPIRFLIAETESGYTLLCALWLARLFGIADRVEISPLFETSEALEHGARVLEEALRSPHYRDYLRRTGRLALQFGYSDSGRYIGQLDATYLIERLRLRTAELMKRFNLAEVEVLLFDTHGESIGRGAHPGSFKDRLRYLSPAAGRRAFDEARIKVREESAFQGGDGYLLFGTPELALATVTGIATHAYAALPETQDPIYDEPDFAADFFATAGISMAALVEDPGYASLLGAFGPALLDPTGSRPSARQSDGLSAAAIIRHPRELRAIPNNAILQQLGWMANTLQGLGAAASRQPEQFEEMLANSPRFRRALAFARHALRHSDLDVLRAVISLIDPASWLDRALHGQRDAAAGSLAAGSGEALAEVAQMLSLLDLWAPAQAMFRRIQADQARLHGVWKETPVMADREILLHALRVTLIGRIWLFATGIPTFSPRHGVTRESLLLRILQLDVPGALTFLSDVFPHSPDPDSDQDYAEPRGPRGRVSYAREHDSIFEPMRRLFDLVREIGTAVTHEVGAFG